MHVCTSQEPIEKQSSHTIKLHILHDAFVLVGDQGVLEIGFDGLRMTRLEAPYEPPKDAWIFEIYGVLGFLDGVREKYLIVMTKRQLLGHIFGHPIYVLEQVACINFDARKARAKLNTKAVRLHPPKNESDSEEDEDKSPAKPTPSISERPFSMPPESMPPIFPTPSTSTPSHSPTTPFGSPWRHSLDEMVRPPQPRRHGSLMARLKMPFGKKTVPEVDDNMHKTRMMQRSASAIETDDLFAALAISEDIALEKRVVKQVTELFSRSMFIFSYDYDISNSFQRSYDAPRNEHDQGPWWKEVDRRFWWNEHLCQNFKTRHFDEWIIPVLQGTLQIEHCEIEGNAFDFILISRRSRERAGMRYQRRGVNEQGQVANFVETEQIVLFYRDNVPQVASFVQTRGSIPLFWSQSPYSLHPIPILDRTPAENSRAFERHFAEQEQIYGRQIAVSLTELFGREAIVGSEYRKHVELLGDPNIKFVEFDFHRETKGMRFENISKLSDSLRTDLEKTAHFWQAGTDTVYCRQKGTFRTNCMDCLDRTNVVQSAFARTILNLQLMRFGISEFPDQGIRYYEDFERVFNNVWANNGDMISRMYAGTSALKGDFTRTGKRDITGMMNDASNSLARMYLNTVKDFWRQATIDYVLGYHKIEIFRHVPQSTIKSAEPGIERRWAKIREDAIEISSAIVIADDEVKLVGWTLLSPNEPNKRRSKTFEEKVVLLTAKALYVCSYNYNLEKVVQFKRIPLVNITSIQIGEYILSSMSPASRSADLNYGLLVYYEPNQELTRLNIGSIRNQSLGDVNMGQRDKEADQASIKSSNSNSSDEEDPPDSSDEEDDRRTFLVFKAVRYNVLGELSDREVLNCREQVESIASWITTACEKDPSQFVVQKPIISLEQAENKDGIFRKMGLKLKHAIWI